jgi:hypothetical protein
MFSLDCMKDDRITGMAGLADHSHYIVMYSSMRFCGSAVFRSERTVPSTQQMARATRQRPAAAVPESTTVLTMPSEEPEGYSKFVRNDDQTLWEWLQPFNSDDWRHLIGYIWRTMPKIDLKAAGRPINIGKITDAFDADWIKRNFGSGGYRIDFSYVPTVGKQTRICQEYFEIYDPNYPPNVEYGDWVDYPDNKNWIWGAKKPDEQPGPAPTPVVQARDGAALLRDAIAIVKDLRGDSDKEAESFMVKMLESNRALIERMDPMRQMETMKTWMDMFRPPVDKKDDRFNEFILQEIRAQREENAKLRELLMKPPTAAAGSDIDRLLDSGEKLEKLAAVFGFKRGSGRTSAAEKEQPIWMEFAGKALDSLAPVATAAANYFFTREPAAHHQAQPHRATIDTTAINPTTGERMQPNNQQVLIVWLKENEKLFMSCAPFMLDEWNSGTPGQNFRDWFIDRKGFEKWREFKTRLGPTGLADLLSQNSYFADMNPRAKVITWLEQVFEDPPPADHNQVEDDEEEDTSSVQPILT